MDISGRSQSEVIALAGAPPTDHCSLRNGTGERCCNLGCNYLRFTNFYNFLFDLSILLHLVRRMSINTKSLV